MKNANTTVFTQIRAGHYRSTDGRWTIIKRGYNSTGSSDTKYGDWDLTDWTRQDSYGIRWSNSCHSLRAAKDRVAYELRRLAARATTVA